jgi:hypothetical protein
MVVALAEATCMVTMKVEQMVTMVCAMVCAMTVPGPVAVLVMIRIALLAVRH